MQITNNISYMQNSNQSASFGGKMYFAPGTMKDLREYARKVKTVPPAITEFVDFIDKTGLKSLYKKMNDRECIELSFAKDGVTRVYYDEHNIVTAFVGHGSLLPIKNNESQMMKEYLETQVIPCCSLNKPKKRLTLGEYINYKGFKNKLEKLKKQIALVQQ